MTVPASHYADKPVQQPAITFIGSGLSRPESVLTHSSGLLFAADWTGNGGVSIINPAGDVKRLLVKKDTDALRPNGIALEPEGTFLMAHLGAETGGLFRLHSNGAVENMISAIDGTALPPCNFPLRDSTGRIWLTVSTRVTPRANDYRPSACSGFIALIDNGVARIVADGLGYTNECALSADEQHLFVNETFARRLTRFDIGADGSLGNRVTIARFEMGTFPDGVVMDVEGHAWITSIVSNRVIRVSPDGRQTIMIEDSDDAHLEWVEQAFQSATMGRPHLDGAKSRLLRNVSSLAFGGEELKTAFLGCLLDDRIATFTAPVAGVRPLHFDFGLGPVSWDRLPHP